MEQQNYQVVVAEFKHYQLFKIPKGLNLEDKTIVEKWWVQSLTLYIKYVDKVTIQIIDCAYQDTSIHYPSKCTIENADETDFDIGFLFQEEDENDAV
jgi:hypothetical protein